MVEALQAVVIALSSGSFVEHGHAHAMLRGRRSDGSLDHAGPSFRRPRGGQLGNTPRIQVLQQIVMGPNLVENIFLHP